ncbi:hypothetical protein TNCT_514511 [Trichonephila clavata]|uniref:Uncharacterized protein n=1 Tax=Trichonephila clavata TaxID=2740835 RepID=A0A8X6J961_TRICU|nr:hypothetical protein TNCT_514511 [Trichonephila clavata]
MRSIVVRGLLWQLKDLAVHLVFAVSSKILALITDDRPRDPNWVWTRPVVVGCLSYAVYYHLPFLKNKLLHSDLMFFLARYAM